MSDGGRGPYFTLLIVVGGLVHGFGLAYSGMARPEVVLDFLQLEDFGLLLVMATASVTAGLTFWGASTFMDRAPLTGKAYTRRIKSMDRNVAIGGVVFGVGWGLSGICPGAGYASVGVGNYQILWGIAGMFVGAYVQGYVRALVGPATPNAVAAD